ncbi:MAG: LemA family protein [Gammaproteobacteria bacterium]|nr:LemA family protein [Gammaproteobacteria bacterium]
MSVTMIVILGLLAVAVAYGAMLYNALVRLKHNVSAAWSNIDVVLKQRHDELPKLVETCKQYMQYEGELLEQITQARASVGQARESQNMKDLGQAESGLRAGLMNLFAVAENYPELKANENFQHLQNRITGLENQIADRREFYNDSVNANNIRIEQFPDVILARMFNFKARDLLEFDVSEIADVNIGALFSA